MSIFSRLTKTNSTGQASLQNNLAASSAPTVNDDSSVGYAVGSLWIDTTGDEAYRCVDASVGSAVWVKTTLDSAEFPVVMASAIDASTLQINPADTDNFPYVKGGILSHFTWVSVKARLKTYFDTLYQDILAEGAFVDGDKTKLDGIAAGATANSAANATEVNTGTDAEKFATADAIAGSYAGTKAVQIVAFDYTTDTAVGDGAAYFRVPSSLNGMNLVAVAARVITAGTTGTTDIQINNVTQAADMLTTKLTIDSGETDSSTAATAAVIDAANDDVATGDLIRIDVDAVSTTKAKGLLVMLEFRLP